DNPNGYAALEQRFESAQRSWASIRETQELYRILARLECGEWRRRRRSVIGDYARVTGNLHQLY
ncbi:MAG: DUF932 domain-containing protein, partial [Planctomycetales bacterium]|nr:DUF932 domain-containing protein [Planctomycetales bacterium]